MQPINQSPPITEFQLMRWMKQVLRSAILGTEGGENPFGAGVFSPDGSALAITCSSVVSTNNPTAHAEINAIAEACRQLGTPDLQGNWLVSTAEPCPMCMAAIATAGIRHVAFGAVQAVVTEAGYGSLGLSGHELANQFGCKMSIHGRIDGNACVLFLLQNRKRVASSEDL